MNVTRITVWSSGQTLTASALNNEFNNLLNAPNIVNADIASGAGIVYSKLNLTGSIVNADISSSAAIAASKIANTAATLTDTQSLSSKTLVTPLVITEYGNGAQSGTYNIDWSRGDRQNITIAGNLTLTFSNAVAGQTLTLWIVENGTGGYSITTPTVKWNNSAAPSFTTTASAVNVIIVRFDGTNYFGMWGVNFG